ncbi:hypothetical protein [Gillisia sp. JM1]|uniref:hypothetical protein n=1 Tax=Gillisia sp. JM1 TaxID=1283286 RepID=UPI000422065A|nr:hypothetical protein [Gillisia sp. JM1]
MKDLNHFQFRGERGKRNLLIIGLYAVDNDDLISRITLQNTDAIAKEEAYDGWIRANPRDTSSVTLRGIVPEIEPGNFIKFDFQHYVHYRKLSLKPEIMIK